MAHPPRPNTRFRAARLRTTRSRAARFRASPVAALAVAALLITLVPAVNLVGAQGIERHGIFLDTVDVNLVNLEVMVFDKDGNPVTGLTAEDFEILEDGEPIAVTNFFAVEDGLRLMGEGGRAAEPAPEAPATASQTAQEPERSYVILFVDNGNIAAPHRKRVFDDLYGMLDRLIASADRVMVVSQDDQITIEQPFTSDRVLLEGAIRKLEMDVGRGALRATQPRIIQRNIEKGQAPPGADTLLVGTDPSGGGAFDRPTYDVDASRTFGEVTSYAQITQEETRRTILALGRFIDSLAGLAGRKAIVYVSDGLELKPGEFLFRVWDFKYATIAATEVGVSNIEAEIQRYSLTPPFEKLLARANANRVTFYTVQGGDTQAYSISAESRTVMAESFARTSDGERQDSLRNLAAATGGVALLNQAALTNLVAQMETDLSTYYSLGYPSPHRGDGEYHRVKVRTRRPGLKVRYLEGYQDKSSDERMTDQTLASLLLDVGDNPLDIRLEVGKVERGKAADGKKGGKGEDGYLVPLLVKVPLSRLVLLPQEDEHLGRLTIFVAVRDAKGRLSEPHKVEFPVRIPNDKLLEALSQSAGWATRLQMRPGEQKIAVGVRDELGAVDSTVNLNLDVGG